MPVTRPPARSALMSALRYPLRPVYSGAGSSPPAAPATARIVFDGNSITSGTGATAGNDYPEQFKSMVTGTTLDKYNFGVPGQTTTAMSGDAAAQIDVLRTGGYGAFYLVAWEITNQIVSGSTGAAAATLMQTYVDARLAAGWDVIIPLCMDRTDFSGAQRTHAATANANLVARYGYIGSGGRCIDIAAADSRFTTAIAGGGSTDVWADGIHPTNFGANIIASVIAAAFVASGRVGGLTRATAPTPGIAAGTYSTYQSTTLTSTSSLLIQYSYNGSDPIETSPYYVRAVPVLSSRTLKAKTYRLHYAPSLVGSTAYTITTAFTPPTTNQLVRYDKGGASGSTWADTSGNGRTLTLFNTPTINGDGSVTFNFGGSNQYGRTASTFSSAQGYVVYMRALQFTGGINRYWFDGYTSFKVIGLTSAGGLEVYAGAAVATNANHVTLALENVCFFANGASSGVQVNFTAATSGNAGAQTLDGFTLAAGGGGGANHTDLKIYGVMAYGSTTHTEAERDAFHQWMLENW